MYKNASFDKRLGAFLIDFIIMLTIGLIIFSIFRVDLVKMLEANTKPGNEVIPTLATNLASYIILFNQFLYYVIIPYDNQGATVGKILLGLKIVNEQGEDITFWRLFGREVIGKYFLGWCLCVIPFIISIFMAITKDGSTFHDTLFHTKVIDTKKPIIEAEQ